MGMEIIWVQTATQDYWFAASAASIAGDVSMWL